MRKIIFVLEQISQPRCIKRIESIKKCGIPFEAWGFDKNIYNTNVQNRSIHFNIFKHQPSIKGKLYTFYLRWKCVYNLIRKSNKNDTFYLFGFDIALITLLSLKNIKYIYEESDITYAGRNKFLFYILRYIDKRIRKKSLFTIFTSEGFVQYFYKNKTIPSNILVHPNKLHPSIANYERKISTIEDTRKLKFGFIGLIRYKTIFNFARVIGENYPHHEFHFWGGGWHQNQVEDLTKKYNNILYHGEFKSPTDLKSIYSQIDILVACYDTSNFNTRVAEPNKLYEAMFFCKPIIVSKGTYIEKKVLEGGIGYSVDASQEINIKELIDKLSIEAINKILQQEININVNDIIDDFSAICHLIKSKL
jgi:glycosyltransferase involved in cell wall biosynthesis